MTEERSEGRCRRAEKEKRVINKIFFCLAVAPYSCHVLCSRGTATKKIPRFGYFSLSAGPSDRDEAFKQGLRELGWVDGQTIVIEYRWITGKPEQLAVAAEELVRLKVDVIFATTA